MIILCLKNSLAYLPICGISAARGHGGCGERGADGTRPLASGEAVAERPGLRDPGLCRPLLGREGRGLRHVRLPQPVLQGRRGRPAGGGLVLGCDGKG